MMIHLGLELSLQHEAPSPMPTQLPRVNVSVTPEQHALLLEMASLDKGRSASGFLREMLDQVTPLLRATVAAMRAAAQEQDNAREQLAGMMAEMQTLMDQRALPLPPASKGARKRSDEGARTARPSKRKKGQ